jgi:hypothetical protein
MKALTEKVLVTRYSSLRTRHEYCTLEASGITVIMTEDEAREMQRQLNELYGNTPTDTPTPPALAALKGIEEAGPKLASVG